MVRLTDRLDMTIADIWDVIPQTKQTKQKKKPIAGIEFNSKKWVPC